MSEEYNVKLIKDNNLDINLGLVGQKLYSSKFVKRVRKFAVFLSARLRASNIENVVWNSKIKINNNKGL